MAGVVAVAISGASRSSRAPEMCDSRSRGSRARQRRSRRRKARRGGVEIWLAREDGGESVGNRGPLEEELAVEQFVNDRAECPDIRAPVGVMTAGLLRSHGAH